MRDHGKHPQQPGCRWLYLRVTVGLLCAFFVLAVALVALLVTTTASLKALDHNGEAHVAALGNAAAFRLSAFFARPEDQVHALSNLTMTEGFMLPSDHRSAAMSEADRVAAGVPRGGTELERVRTVVTTATFDSNMSLFATTFWIGDGSRVIQFPIPQVENALYIERWWPDNVTGLLAHRETTMYDTATRQHIGPSDPRYHVFMPSRARVTGLRNQKTFDTLAGLVHRGRGQPGKWSVPRFFHQVVPYRYVICVKELYNATHFYGFGIAGVTLGSIGRRLDDVQSSSTSSVALLVGDGGFVLGSAGGRETFNVTSFTGGAVGAGCSTTDMTHNTIRSDRRLISCMHHMKDVPIPVVRKIDSTHGHNLFDHDSQQFRCLDRSFVRIQRLRGVSMKAVVIVVVSERDIIGNVQHEHRGHGRPDAVVGRSLDRVEGDEETVAVVRLHHAALRLRCGKDILDEPPDTAFLVLTAVGEEPVEAADVQRQNAH